VYEAFQFAVPAEVQVIKDRLHYNIVIDPDPNFWVHILQRPLSQILTELQDRFEQYQHVQISSLKNDQVRLRDSDFVICGGGHAPILCAYLVIAFNLPILFSIQAPLAFHIPPDPDARLKMMTYLHLALQSRQVVPCVDVPFLQEQILEQTGQRLPLVRNHAWFIPRVGSRGPHDGRILTAFYAPASMFPDMNGHALFFFLYEHVLETDASLAFVVKSLGKQPPEMDKSIVRAWEDYWSEQRTTLGSSLVISAADMKMHFDRFVIMPWDVNLLSFDELYSMEVPLFLPDPAAVSLHWCNTMRLTARAGQDYPLYLLRRQHADAGVPSARNSSHPFKPWVDDPMNPQLEVVRYWVTFSNWAQWPGVVYFHGVPDMMIKLMSTDVKLMTSRMDAFNSDTWEHTLQWYRWVTQSLLPGSTIGAWMH
jgi:hypothetical protein